MNWRTRTIGIGLASALLAAVGVLSANRQPISPASIFIHISGGAVSVAMPIFTPRAFILAKLRNRLPIRAETSGEWASVTPCSA